jgi:hypothetical protein
MEVPHGYVEGHVSIDKKILMKKIVPRHLLVSTFNEVLKMTKKSGSLISEVLTLLHINDFI